MYSFIRYAVLATILGVGPGIAWVSAQTTMIEYKYEGETFQIQQVYEGVYEVRLQGREGPRGCYGERHRRSSLRLLDKPEQCICRWPIERQLRLRYG